MSTYNLGTASGRIMIDGSGAQKGFAVAQAAAESFFAVVQNKLDSVRQLGDNLTKLGATGSAGIGLAVRSAANFEERLSAVKAVSGATAQEMKRLSDAALRIGKDTKYSATEAASAMEELVKAGLSVDDVLNGAADATVNLAAAGEISLPRAAELAATAMNNFNLKGKDMPRVADLIAGAANASAISVDEFGASMSQSGAVAALTGLKFDDLAVAIAEMGNAGIKGSDAGTSIKTFLTNLIPTMDKQIGKFEELGLIAVDSGKAMGAFAKLGIKPVDDSMDGAIAALEKYNEAQGGAKAGSVKARKEAMELGNSMGILKNQFFDTNGNIKSMADIQEVLKNATKGMTKETKLATLELLFGSDAIRAAAVLSEEGAAGFDKMATSMGKVTAADVAATRMDNLKGSIEELKGAFETMMIVIGNVFLPIVRRVVDAMTGAVNIFNNLPEGVQKAIGVFLGLGTAMSLITGIMIKLAFILAPMLAKFLGLRALSSVFSIFKVGFGVMRAGGGAVLALQLMFTRAATVFTRFAKIGQFVFKVLARFPGILMALRTAAAFAFGPWGIAIALVVAALVILYKKFEPFKKLVDGVASAIKDGLIAALNYLKDAFGAVVEGFRDSEEAGSGPLEMWYRLGDGIQVLVSFLKELVDTFKSSVLPVLKEAGGQIMQALITAWKQISAAVTGSLLPALRDLRDTFVNDVLPALKELWTAISPVVIAVGKFAAILTGLLLFALFQVVKAFITYVLPAFIQVQAFILKMLIPVIATLITWIIKIVAAAIKFGIAFVTAVVNAFKAVVSSIVQFNMMLVNGIIAAFNAVKDAIVAAFEFIKGIITTALTAIKAAWDAYWNLFGPLVMAVFELIGAALKLAMAAILFIITAPLKLIYEAWMATWNAVKSVLTAVWNFIGPYVMASVNAIKDTISKKLQEIKTAWNTAWNAIKSFVRDAWNAIKSSVITPVTEMASKVGNKASEIKNHIQSKFNDAKNIASRIFQEITNVVGQKIDAARAKVANAVQVIRNLFNGARGWLTGAGRDIIQGLIDGIASMIGRVTGMLNNLTSKIPDWKGPASVDKKLLTENGELIMESLIKGFNNREADVMRQLKAITTDIGNSASVGLESSLAMVGAGTGTGKIVPTAPDETQEPREVNLTMNNYNPVEEKSSETVVKNVSRASALGLFG